MTRWFLLLASVATLLVAAPPGVQARGQTWTVISGGMTRDGAVWSNAFHPRVLDISVGDTVEWRFEGFHNVAFAGGEALPPLVVMEGKSAHLNPRVAFPVGGEEFAGSGYRNSGLPPEDPKGMAQFRYALRFTRPGVYTYSCIVHGPAMSGTIRVHATGAQLPRSPESALQQGRREQQATLAAGSRALAGLRPELSGRKATVRLVGDAQRGYSLMRYTRQPLVVRRGTAVTWEMRDPFEIHTVTFVGGGPVPTFVVPQPQSGRPPKLLLNPKVLVPTGQREHQPGYINSGLLAPAGAPGVHTYTLRFNQPGTYTYWCPIHAAVGMKGTIVVK